MSPKSLNILIIGAGGREHAILNQLLKSPTVASVYITNGGNGGTATLKHSSINVENVSIGSSKAEFPKLLQFAIDKGVDLVIPGPELPLIDGISDYIQNNNSSGKKIAVFGPDAKAAYMEGSKTFSKDFMKKHNIPTAAYGNFSKYEDAKAYILAHQDKKLVIKASGVAAGKGVLIPTSVDEALEALDEVMVKRSFGDAGDEVVIEEYLEGDEISILTISDGYSFINFPPSQDHKKVGINDTGLNTGGMGSYAPTPIATTDPTLLPYINDKIVKPSIDGMRKDGFPFIGVLFTGLILTEDQGPKVLEYNVRFGDPETQSVLPLINDKTTDLAQVFLAAAERRLDSVHFEIDDTKYATTVVLAANGYPSAYEKGNEITIDYAAIDKLNKNVSIVHAGTRADAQGRVLTNGGRVLGVTSVSDNLKQSVANVYDAIKYVDFKEKYFRTDIAHRAFKLFEKKQQKEQRAATALKQSITYADSGVSVDNGNLLVEKIKSLVKSTARAGADSDIGGFGGLFDLDQAGYSSARDTLLVAATDGVGTKLRIAQESNIHDTVGVDLVAMNVNDLVVQGAEPLFFLDYFATGKLDIQVAHDFVKGVADGCKISGCALVGGETSEMPGMYEGNHYDTNGTAVGAVLKNQILPKVGEMQAGDVILGLKSDGLHSNGFSLVRKIIEVSQLALDAPAPWVADGSQTVAEACLVPTRIYVKPLLKALKSDVQSAILGLAHITGGGLVENLPRCLPVHLAGKIRYQSWDIPAIFKWLGKNGNVPTTDFFKTFNGGIGMVVVVKNQGANVATVQKILESAGETVYNIGELVERKEGVPATFIDGLVEEGFYN